MVQEMAVVEMRGEEECVCVCVVCVSVSVSVRARVRVCVCVHVFLLWLKTDVLPMLTVNTLQSLQKGNEGILTHGQQLMHYSPLTSRFHQNPSLFERFSLNTQRLK